jgi:hypothetical protein
METASSSNDQTFVGSPHPDLRCGLTNEFTWKEWTSAS